ncbi:hypothetical protein [Methylomonas albis]|uniref:PEGA domain-containing protein n=1 Tax=Methylomonas albis TaxID=1854563 RepID=A0ABR9D5W3_9GAMM|nr:hypothetical protein [Methylomonas albis]MBD9358528.1 hypothetical protein [Methylomonas albis]
MDMRVYAILFLIMLVSAFVGRRVFNKSLIRRAEALRSGPTQRPHTSITVERDGGVVFIRPCIVFIDNEKVGDIAPGETKHFQVESGDHLVQVRLDWCRSKKSVVHVDSGTSSRLQCGVSSSIERDVGSALWRSIFTPWKILYLHPISNGKDIKIDDGKDLIPLTLGFCNFSGDDFLPFLEDDKAALSQLFKNINIAPVTKIPSCEVLFLYADLLENGMLRGTINSAGIKQVAQLTGAKIIVLASPNGELPIRNAINLPGPKTANLIFTLNRNGDGFSRFFRDLFELMRAGKPMLNAWLELAPQHANAMPSYAPATLALNEAGNLQFPVMS